MQYDGSGKLAEAIADLFELSPKSQEQVAKRIKEAKTGLGITSKAKVLPDDVKLSIWQWHYDRLNPVQDVKQVDNLVQSVDDTIVQDVKQTDGNNLDLPPNSAVQYIKQTDDGNLDLLPDRPVQDVKQDNPVQDVKQDAPAQDDGDTDSAVYDFKQIHFAVMFAHQGHTKRTTVMLESYLVKALQQKHGLADNSAVRGWIEQAVKADGVRFDSNAPLTRQVKRIIIESLV